MEKYNVLIQNVVYNISNQINQVFIFMQKSNLMGWRNTTSKSKMQKLCCTFHFKIHFSTYVLCLYAVMGNWCSKIFDLTHSTSGVSCLRSNSKYPCGLATALVYADVRNRGSERNILIPIVLICETSAGFLKSTTYCTFLCHVISSHEDVK